MEFYDRAQALEEQAGNINIQATALHNMAWVAAVRERWDTAMEFYERARSLEEQAGDIHGQGLTLQEMGNVEAARKQWDIAMDLYRQALSLAVQAGDIHGQEIDRIHAFRGEVVDGADDVPAFPVLPDRIAVLPVTRVGGIGMKEITGFGLFFFRKAVLVERAIEIDISEKILGAVSAALDEILTGACKFEI